MIRLIIGDTGENSPDDNVIEIMQDAANKILIKDDFIHRYLGKVNADGSVISFEDYDVEISLSFASQEEIKKYNNTWRKIDKVTDVLSFPQYNFSDISSEEEQSLINILETTHTANIGDVVICVDKAKEQAEEYGHTVERELVYLFVHSVFHLLGRDHKTEESKMSMRNEEKMIMKELRLSR